MEQCCGQELCWQSGSVQEGTHFDSQFFIVDFCCTILGGAVGASGFDNVVKIRLHKCLEVGALCQLTALISPDETFANTKFGHEGSKDVQGWFLSADEEDPYAS